MKRRGANRVGAAVAAVGLVWLVSCDLSPHPGSFYSISRLLLPSPGVVLGDTMRDSTGAAAPLRVIAYNATGDVVTTVSPYFITLDTFSHLANGTTLIGDRIGTARVIGGIANVQTLPETVKVTLSPDTIIASDSVHHLKTYNLLTDSLVNSAELGAIVQHIVAGGTNTTVDAVIVKYSLVSAPPSKNTLPTVVIMNGSAVSAADTTSAGRAARTLRLNVNRLTNVNPDSAVVNATASYRGVTIGTVQFTVVFKTQ
jgi:hypothetical protein